MRAMTTLGVLGLWVILGCGGYEPAAPPPAAPGSQQAKAATAPKPAPAQPSAPTQSGQTLNMAGASAAAGLAPMDLMSGPQAVQPARAAQPAPQPSAPGQKADVGAGKRGHGYGIGFVATPAATYWRAQEMIAFRIQIPENMKLYKATNGSAPKNHEEFMEKIIKEGQVKLPDLPPGQRYVYKPDKEELWIEPAQ